MDAEHAGHGERDRVAGSGDRALHDGGIVADQGRQEAGGAEPAMRAADRGDGLDAGVVVEQHAAAAIDLGVDEAMHEVATIKVNEIARRRFAMQHGDDEAVFHDHAHIAFEPAFGEDVGVLEDVRRHAVILVSLPFAQRRGGLGRGCLPARSNPLPASPFACGERGRRKHQTVSVTFLRCGGTSGSCPRAIDSAFAAP